jgi:hypothetical protein
MKQTYKSKVETMILVPLALLLFITELLMLINRFWVGAALCLLIVGFIIYLYYFTSYEVTPDKKLKIRSGFLYHKEIYIPTIKKVRAIRSHLVSPALSADRLEICYHRYGRVLISPEEATEFISQLMKLNPRIKIG